jgi:uncharacterized RDD family membrane protein YckC
MEGALAPKPAPLRELPGTRKKEKTWRDEVNERVRSRRQKRQDETGLPLFDQVLETPETKPKASPDLLSAGPRPVERGRLEDAVIAEGVDEAVADLPLRHGPRAEESADDGPALREEADLFSAAPPQRERAATPPSSARAPETVPEDALLRSRTDEEWPLELEPPPPQAQPLERPALFAERVRAGAVDLGLLSLLGLVVVYFASRAARVSLVGLLPAWPWLLGYLAFLGVAYATYFTGTTGQTLGKMIFQLRVVDTAGQPPGYLRAMLRSAMGVLSVAAVGLGVLPMAFDPARRAFHDRAFRTRVVRG